MKCIALDLDYYPYPNHKAYLQNVSAKCKAPGPPSLRPSHLREAVACPSPDRAHEMLSALTKFINLLAAGQVPSSIRPYLCGATLLASKKKNGGLHPIAVGEVLRRLVSKCLALITCPASLSALAPLQLGVEVKGGCEAISCISSHEPYSIKPTMDPFARLLKYFQQH